MKTIAITLAILAAGYSAQAAAIAPVTDSGTDLPSAAAPAASVNNLVSPAPAYTLTTDFTYASEYIFRGQKESNAAFQASAEIGYQNFYGGVWTNQPLHNENNEVDLYLGYTFALQNYWKIDTGLTSYNYSEGYARRYQTLSSGFSSYESYVGLTGGSLFSGTSYAIMPSIYGYYDWKLDNYVLQGSLGYSLPIKQIGTSLDFAVTYGFTPDTGRYNSGIGNGTYWGVGVTIPYHLSPNATLTAGLQYSGNSQSVTTYGEAYKLAYTLGLTLGF